MINRKAFFTLVLALTLSTLLWVALMIVSMSKSGAILTAADALHYITHPTPLFSAVYINATLLTVLNVVVVIRLTACIREKSRAWAALSLAFTAVYGLLNLFVYGSQVTVVPRLLALYQVPEYRASVEPALLLSVQAWSGSLVAMLNSLAYGLFGIPSIVLGVVMAGRGGWVKAAGVLYAASGFTAILGFAGVLLGSQLLSAGIMVSGFLYLVGLVLLCVAVGKGEIKSTQEFS